MSINYTAGNSATAAAATYTGAVTPGSATGGTFTASNYNITYVVGNVIVDKANLLIGVDNEHKAYGVALNATTGVPTQLTGIQNAETVGSVNITYGTGAAATDAVGTYTGQVFTAGASGGTFNTTNYNITYSVADLLVDKAVQNITYTGLASKSYGDADFTPGAVSNNSSIPITYSSDNPAVATIVADKIHIVSAGSVNITAHQAGDSNYLASSDILQGLTVSKANLTISAANQTKAYGAAMPALTAHYTGFVNGDNNTNLTTQPSLSTTALMSSPAGNYPIIPGGAASANYAISYVAGALTVDKAILIITAIDKNKTYGEALPTLTAGYNGFVNGDTNATLTIQPTLTTTGLVSSPVGTYPINAGSATSPNYTISYVTGTLRVDKSALTITADNKSKIYGDSNPVLTATYTGFVNGDNTAGLTTQPSFVTNATTVSPVGNYPVTVSGAASSNYTISYAPGTFAINAKTIAVTAVAKSKIYGAADPALTYTFTPVLVGGDNFSGAISRSVGEDVGTYVINKNTLALNNNYALNYTGANLTIGKAALTIAADSKSKSYGAANPTLTATYIGFVNGDNASTLTNQPTITTLAIANSSAGSYPITASSAVSSNYAITYQPGTLTVSNVILTVTVDNKTKIYGSPNPGLTVTYSGFVNGDTQASITTQPTITTTATTSSGTGTYPITANGVTMPGYAITYVPGILTVNKAQLTITADNKTKLYGTANPALTANYTGFVNGDNSAGLTTQPTLINTATTTTLPGNYDIAVVSAASNNYTITNVKGILTVIPLTDAVLSNLSISKGTLSPAFNAGMLSYTISVPYYTDRVTLTANFGQTTSASINGTAIPNGSESFTVDVPVGTSTITVLVMAQDGITKNSYLVTIYKASPPTAIIPSNILSPNGDGKNDGWVIKDIEQYPDNEVTIYDRGGRQIYKKKGYHNDWNGTITGAPLAQGTYFYIVELGPGIAPIKGFITILISH